MNIRKWHWSTSSLQTKLALSVLIMTLPLVGLLFYNNFYAIHVVRGQVADSYTDTFTLYMNQIDEGLNDVDAYMNTLAFGNDLLAIGQAVTDDDYYTAKFYLYNKLSQEMAWYPSLSSFFVYEEKRQEYMDISSGYTERESIKNYVIDLIHRKKEMQGDITKRWQYHQIGDEHYLIDIVKAGDAYLGAWVRTKQLIAPLRTLKLGKEGEILFANDQGKPITVTNLILDKGIELRQDMTNYYLSGSDRKYLVVGEHSSRGNFSLFALIPDKNILDKLPYLQRVIWIITFGAMVFIPVGLYLMRRSFLIPLNRVLLAMKKVRGGDWGVQVNMHKTSEEFLILGNSFNSMMTEIQMLRVNVFEEQLNKQREELQRLQLQVNPHFFLNALNIVYNLAKVKNFELILEMTMSLIQYFRYLFRSNTSFVKLEDELEHTRYYLNIQSLRFPGQLTWTIDAPVYLTETPVPPLIVQSFVENSIKHAVTLDEPIDIAVQIDFLEEEKGMKIIIKDTGRGFADDVLKELQAGRSVQNDRGEHTGIWNIGRRLRLLYNDTVTIRYFNDTVTGGAVVEIMLSTEPELEEML
ncbi:sensor histidine kinase [Paenibacillus prosopidis]|uniref:Two-component system sensor histidine kinase YesM n=1 Tax=Paenibacillus prosopidis TaxID=630520 RepID=A0A368VPP9_9BACL|nr:histidine kinase [Paenibacillus prosopidis]RCW43510.1 two-component system sensor histidine kinase YesM [Paenibacillus prosopidis]